MQLKLQTIQLMNFTKRIRTWKDSTPSTIQQIPTISWKPEAQYLFTISRHMSLSWTFMNAVRSITSISPKVN